MFAQWLLLFVFSCGLFCANEKKERETETETESQERDPVLLGIFWKLGAKWSGGSGSLSSIAQ